MQLLIYLLKIMRFDFCPRPHLISIIEWTGVKPEPP